MREILIATGNKGKISEFKSLLGDLNLSFRSLADFSNIAEVSETGATFDENARLKAKDYSKQTGLPTLADDSGLEILALGNAPGVFSARYGGTELSDHERIEKVLFELEKTLDLERRARFVCVIAVTDGKGEIKYTATGVCNGRISTKPLGSNGFGYDPIFVPDGFENTFGELSAAVKHKISHRAQAADQIMRLIRDNLQI